jgi:hypothetical protein
VLGAELAVELARPRRLGVAVAVVAAASESDLARGESVGAAGESVLGDGLLRGGVFGIEGIGADVIGEDGVGAEDRRIALPRGGKGGDGEWYACA